MLVLLIWKWYSGNFGTLIGFITEKVEISVGNIEKISLISKKFHSKNKSIISKSGRVIITGHDMLCFITCFTYIRIFKKTLSYLKLETHTLFRCQIRNTYIIQH